MKSHIKLKNTERGDTIVEVLLAIAVISSVLAGAFGVTQKSAQAVRDSQEHAEVLELVQGQVELVRQAAQATADTTDPLFSTSPFCMNSAGSQVSSSSCAHSGQGGLYALSETYVPAQNVFLFTGQWTNIHGSLAKEQISYRVYPGQ